VKTADLAGNDSSYYLKIEGKAISFATIRNYNYRNTAHLFGHPRVRGIP